MTRIELWNGDICDLEVDAIVNAANLSLWMSTGVGGEIKRAGGDSIEFAAVRQAPVPLGEAIVTPAGRLEEFLTESAHAAREGLYNSRNMPTSWRGAVWVADFAQRFRDETVVTSPPPAVQRILTPLVARFAR